MKQTAVEALWEAFTKMPYSETYRDLFEQAYAQEREQMLHIIETYHANLFYLPLRDDGEAERILELIRTGQIKKRDEQTI